MPDTRSPLGILGGTFDPIHTGHLQLAQAALASLHLSGVIWIPAGYPPHRHAPQAAPEHRLKLLKLALSDNAAFTVDPTEVQTPAPSYTVHTLERLRREHGPARPLVLLMGADAFTGLDRWHRWTDILNYSHLGIANRPGSSLAAQDLPRPLHALLEQQGGADPAVLTSAPAGRIVSFPMTPCPISATAIRAALASGESVTDLLPPKVLDYIGLHSLYPLPHPSNGT